MITQPEMLDSPILRAWSKDEKAAALILTPDEVRFLVDFYYTAQDYRISAANQIRSAEGKEPNAVLGVLLAQSENVELRIKQALDTYTSGKQVGVWLKSLYGIGPVIAAGLLAHIDIKKAPTAGHIWNYAGLNPCVEWGKGQKRPWNARLKVLCWKAGQSFMKFHNRDECYYGKLYAARKALEVSRNEESRFADQAAAILTKKKIGKETDAYAAYSTGKLPPAQIDARARRYAVKMFLSHLQEVWWFLDTGQMPPKPYVLEHLGHVDYLPPPNLEFVPGFAEAKKSQSSR